jgi:hypothetical protein
LTINPHGVQVQFSHQKEEGEKGKNRCLGVTQRARESGEEQGMLSAWFDNIADMRIL